MIGKTVHHLLLRILFAAPVLLSLSLHFILHWSPTGVIGSPALHSQHMMYLLQVSLFITVHARWGRASCRDLEF